MLSVCIKTLLIAVTLLVTLASAQTEAQTSVNQTRLKTKVSKTAIKKEESKKAWAANLLTRYQKFYKNETNNTWNELTLRYSFLEHFYVAFVNIYIQQMDAEAYEESDFWDPEFVLGANIKFDTDPKFTVTTAVSGMPPQGSAWAYKHDFKGAWGAHLMTALEWSRYVIATKTRVYSYYFGYSDTYQKPGVPQSLTSNTSYYYDNGIAGILSITDSVKMRNEVRLESSVPFYGETDHLFHVRNGMGYIINKNVNVWLALDCVRSLSKAESNFEPKNQIYQLSFYWSI